MLIIQLSRGPLWIRCGCASSVLMRDQSGVGLSAMKGVWNPARTCHFLLEPSIFEKVSLLLEAYAGLAGKIMLLLKNYHVASYIRDVGHPNLCQNNYFLHLTSSHLDTSTEKMQLKPYKFSMHNTVWHRLCSHHLSRDQNYRVTKAVMSKSYRFR